MRILKLGHVTLAWEDKNLCIAIYTKQRERQLWIGKDGLDIIKIE